MNMNNIKQQLYNLCKQRLEQSIKEIESTIAERREAVSNETKSSMGDKYETTREMLQQDINMNLERLSKVKADLATLNTINPENLNTQISPGAFVKTDNGNFFIAVSIGKMKLDSENIFIISAHSPIAVAMKGKKVKNTFTFNSKQYHIKEVL